MMFGSFSASAIAVLAGADANAVARSAGEIGTIDIAVAVLTHLGGEADPSLSRLERVLTSRVDSDIGPPEPAQLRRLSASDAADRIPDQRLPFAESAIATFRAAWKKAKWDGRARVDEYDLLTAAIEQPALAQARAAAGIELDEVRKVISDLRQAEPG